MKKITLILIAIVTLTGCYKEPVSTETKANGFQVEFLFEKDGINVYRFRDGGRAHYFTTRGETISTQSDGKHTRDELITNYE
jgi:hypothetical protein